MEVSYMYVYTHTHTHIYIYIYINWYLQVIFMTLMVYYV